MLSNGCTSMLKCLASFILLFIVKDAVKNELKCQADVIKSELQRELQVSLTEQQRVLKEMAAEQYQTIFKEMYVSFKRYFLVAYCLCYILTVSQLRK